jgi:hypothetical protein
MSGYGETVADKFRDSLGCLPCWLQEKDIGSICVRLRRSSLSVKWQKNGV